MAASAPARRDVPILALAVGVSAGGDIAAITALAVHMQATTGSGLLVAAVYAANWLALAAVSPWAGRLVDRVESRAVLGWASLAQAAVAGLLALTPGTGPTLALVALLGIGGAFAVPAEFALAGAIGGTTKVNGRIEAARYAGYALGPLAGGGLAAAAGTGGALLLDAASFLVIVAGAALLKTRRRPDGASAPAQEKRGGLALLGADPQLRLTIIVLVASLVAMSVSISADVFFVATTLGAGSLGLGLLYSAWMAGMVAGSIGLAPRVPMTALATVAIVAAGLQGTSKLLAAAIAVLPAVLVLYSLGGVVHGVKNVTARTLIHQRVPAAAHGRAFAAYSALRNGAELAALALGGLLVELIGARATLAAAGGGTLLVALAGLAALTTTRVSRVEQRPDYSVR
jgi:predicted MFS family arabinose efflux permease